ncbi:hypothetical protein Btru_022251 [Bulinus truncatus]|nr:hypothetical protein Btru_022251 [Bulinus truncatus]
MIQLDPPSDVEMTYLTPFHLPADDNRTSEPHTVGLTDILDPNPSEESEPSVASKNVKRKDLSFITLDPPDDVIFIHNFRCKSPEVSKLLYLTPEPYCNSVPVQNKMRTPDVSLGQNGFQFTSSSSQKSSAELDRRSKKLPSSDLSDVGSDSPSLVSTASDASDCFDETRRGDCDMTDRQLSGQCGCCELADKPPNGPCCSKRQNSITEAPISLAFSDFSDVFDSTIFSMRSVRPSNPPELRVSAPPPLLARHHDDVVRLTNCPKKQRAASVNCCQYCPAGERPSYSKSISVDCRCDSNLGQDGVRWITQLARNYLTNCTFRANLLTLTGELQDVYFSEHQNILFYNIYQSRLRLVRPSPSRSDLLVQWHRFSPIGPNFGPAQKRPDLNV